MRGLSQEEIRDVTRDAGLSAEQVRKRFIRTQGLDVGCWIGEAPVSTTVDATIVAPPAAATASAAVPVPEVLLLPAASAATASAPAPIPEIRILPAAALATASSVPPVPTVAVDVPAGLATASGPVPVVVVSGDITVVAVPAVATASAVEPTLGFLSDFAPSAAPMMRGLSPESFRDIALGRGLSDEPAPRKRFIRTQGLDVGCWVGGDVTTIVVLVVAPPAIATADGGTLDEVAVDVLPSSSLATATAPPPSVSVSGGTTTVVAPAALATASRVAPTPIVLLPVTAAQATATRPPPTVSSGAVSATISVPSGLATAVFLVPRIKKTHHFVLVPDPNLTAAITLDQSVAGPVVAHPEDRGLLTGSLDMNMNTPTG